MNKIVLFCFAVFALHAGEPAKQTQADASFGNGSVNLTPYLKHLTSDEKAPDTNGFIKTWL